MSIASTWGFTRWMAPSAGGRRRWWSSSGAMCQTRRPRSGTSACRNTRASRAHDSRLTTVPLLLDGRIRILLPHQFPGHSARLDRRDSARSADRRGLRPAPRHGDQDRARGHALAPDRPRPADGLLLGPANDRDRRAAWGSGALESVSLRLAGGRQSVPLRVRGTVCPLLRRGGPADLGPYRHRPVLRPDQRDLLPGLGDG